MSPAKAPDSKFRIAGSVKRIGARWYAVVTIHGIDGTNYPVREYRGPDDGLATEQEALIYYFEKVKPTLAEVAARASKAGGHCKTVHEPTLH
jgi:hypothetical protein